MHVSEALDRINEIHEHLAKGEIYRGYRPAPVAASGFVGLLAALFQSRWLAVDEPRTLIGYWVGVALFCGLLAGGTILRAYLFRDDEVCRRRTRRVVGQFLPSLVAGAGLTVAVARLDATYAVLLPGLWAVLFGLGIFASRPYLPRATGWVGLFYLSAGLIVLSTAPADATHWGWCVGGVFGVGQLAVAGVLHCNLERSEHG